MAGGNTGKRVRAQSLTVMTKGHREKPQPEVAFSRAAGSGQQPALSSPMVTLESDLSILWPRPLSKAAHVQCLIDDYKAPAPLPQL